MNQTMMIRTQRDQIFGPVVFPVPVSMMNVGIRKVEYNAAADRREGRKHIASRASTVRACWEQCCRYDDMDPESKFVVFSKSNPYTKFYDIATRELTEAVQQFNAGGYVGLKIERS